MVGKVFEWQLLLAMLCVSSHLYGVESSSIQAAVDRYKVVGVISEESPRKPLAGIAVVKDTRTSQTHTLSIGDALPGDPALSIVSTKAGTVTVSNGRDEANLSRAESSVDEGSQGADLGDDAGTSSWEGKRGILGMSSAIGKETYLLPDSKSRNEKSSLGAADDKVRFPYYKAPTDERRSTGEGENAVDPFVELESFSEDWQWMPAADGSDAGVSELSWIEPEAPRILEDTESLPWWAGEDDAR